MVRKVAKVTMGAAMLLSLGVVAANASIAQASTPTWTSVFRGGVTGEVTALANVNTGNNAAQFAFVSNGSSAPEMYSRTNNESWALDHISVAKPGEVVIWAKAVGPNEVFFFTRLRGGGGRVLKFIGKSEKVGSGEKYIATFSVVKAFSAEIGSASVVTAKDIWVFGSSAAGAGKLGVWHYNGTAWKQVAASLTDGLGLSGTGAWAIAGTTIATYNGSKWTATSLASLFPAKSATDTPSLTDIYTGQGTSYAIGENNTKNAGAGFVVLEYNGHTWVKVASYAKGAPAPIAGAAAPDGGGGLWIAVYQGSTKSAELLHYIASEHTFTEAAIQGLTTLPGDGILTINQVNDYTPQLVGGYVKNANGSTEAKVYYLN